MQWELALLVLFLAPGLAAAHGTEPHANATHEATQPGPWPPANDSAPAQRPTGLPPPGAYEASVPGPGIREWLVFKGDAMRTGSSGAVAPRAPEKAWDAKGTLGTGIVAPPVVAHGLVVFAGLDRKVHAVDGITGLTQWTADLPAMAFASPAVADDKVLVAAADGTLLALDLLSGGERWRVALGGRTTASPLLVSGVVYAATEAGRVVALDVGDGKLRWNRTMPPMEDLVSPMWTAGRLILGDRLGNVHALHPLTGQLLWSSDVGAPVTATPVGVGYRILVPALGLKSLEADTGRVAWSKPAGAFVRSSPAVRNGVLVYGDPEEPGLVAASVLNGERLWRVPTRLEVRSPPVIAGDVAIAASEDGMLVAAVLRNGTVLWSLDAGERTKSAPVVVDGRVVVGRVDGVLRMFADPEAPSVAPGGPATAAQGGNGLLGLLPVLAVLGLPYLGARLWLRRMRARAAQPEPAPPAPRPAPRGTGPVRVACPRCACRFGVEPRHHAIVECPACGLKSVVRRKPLGGAARG